MRMTTLYFAITAAIFVCHMDDARGDSGSIAVGPTTGISFRIGMELASLFTIEISPTHKIRFDIETSDDFVDVIGKLRAGKVDFALVPAAYLQLARTSSGPFAGEPAQADLRIIAAMWHDVEHLLVRNDHVETGTASDLFNARGKKILFKSYMEPMQEVLSSVGLENGKNVDLIELTASQADILPDDVLAMSVSDVMPSTLLEDLLGASAANFRLLEITDAQAQQLDADQAIWLPYLIPAFTYPGQSEAIKTLAQPGLLVAHENVDDDIVYQVTKTLFENAGFLWKSEKALLGFSPDFALNGVQGPMHYGAARYYQEEGHIEHTFAGRDASPKNFVLYFDSNSDKLSKDALLRIGQIRRYVEQVGSANLWIRGFADSAGDPDYNFSLSQIRANVVADFLRHQNANIQNVQVSAFGERVPSMPTSDGIARLSNRRVEVLVEPLGSIGSGLESVSNAASTRITM